MDAIAAVAVVVGAPVWVKERVKVDVGGRHGRCAKTTSRQRGSVPVALPLAVAEGRCYLQVAYARYRMDGLAK